LKLVHTTPPDVHVAFRLANSMLTAVDVLCDKLDVTRSQFIRKSIRERIKAWCAPRLTGQVAGCAKH
jgi:hypothetical protein